MNVNVNVNVNVMHVFSRLEHHCTEYCKLAFTYGII